MHIFVSTLLILAAVETASCWKPQPWATPHRRRTRFSPPKMAMMARCDSSSSTKNPNRSLCEKHHHQQPWENESGVLPTLQFDTLILAAVVWGSSVAGGEFFTSSSCQASEPPTSFSVPFTTKSPSDCTQQQSVQKLFQHGHISERDISKLCEMNDCDGAGQGRCATTTSILTIPLQSSEPTLLPGSLIPTLYPTWLQQLLPNDESNNNKIHAVDKNVPQHGLYGDRLDHYFESILDGLDK